MWWECYPLGQDRKLCRLPEGANQNWQEDSTMVEEARAMTRRNLGRYVLLVSSIVPMAAWGEDGAILAVPLLLIAGWPGWKVPFTEASFKGNRRLEAALFWLFVSWVTSIYSPLIVFALFLAWPVSKRINGPAYIRTESG